MTSFLFPHIRIIQFAKAPEPGNVKTRMAPALQPEQSLQLHTSLTAWISQHLSDMALCPVELWAASSPGHPFFLALSEKLQISVHQQHGDDLGQRMQHAAEKILQRSQAVIIVGSDCPFIDKHYLQQTIDKLNNGADIVVGPAEDGGYVMIALRRVHSAIFSAIDWGTDRVWAQTQQALNHLGWQYAALSPLSDIDRPDDLGLLDCPGLSPQLQAFARYKNRP